MKAGAAAAALQVTSPFIIRALGDTPYGSAWSTRVTGVYAAVAQGELEGAKLATDQDQQERRHSGPAGELLIEDSANDVGTGVQKTRKLIERDQVSFIIGDVNSAIAIAMTQVTSEKKVLHIVSGGHTDPITGSSCSWNVFRVCNSTAMDANAIAMTLIDKFGKKWYFLTPDYAYGHSVQAGFEEDTQGHGRHLGRFAHTYGHADYSCLSDPGQGLWPEVVINVMGGGDQVKASSSSFSSGWTSRWPSAARSVELESSAPCPMERASAGGPWNGGGTSRAFRMSRNSTPRSNSVPAGGHRTQLVRLCVGTRPLR